MQAIHPGYGFLSENADFAEVCRACNIEFIGPPQEAMQRLGQQEPGPQAGPEGRRPRRARQRRTDRPATRTPWTWPTQIGYPVLIKAAAGGGGRGMRVARDDSSLKTGLTAARQEAETAFKDGSVYLEKYIEQPRHVEVQILADQHGNVVHLWERDCSLQRRHQKLVEESPAPNLPDRSAQRHLRRRRPARQGGRLSQRRHLRIPASTRDHRFYFIEVNARIQVEHPVTELVTGIDLVKEQIRIAAGEPLAVHPGGHRPSRLRHRVPHQRRGPRQPVSARRRA